MATSDNINDNPPVPPFPGIDENYPGLGRNSGRLASNRIASGGLSDDPTVENPVRDSNPIGAIKPGSVSR